MIEQLTSAIADILRDAGVVYVYETPVEAIEGYPAGIVGFTHSVVLPDGATKWRSATDVEVMVLVDTRQNLVDGVAQIRPWCDALMRAFSHNDRIALEAGVSAEIVGNDVRETILQYAGALHAAVLLNVSYEFYYDEAGLGC